MEGAQQAGRNTDPWVSLEKHAHQAEAKSA
jgi:hypothetical protein